MSDVESADFRDTLGMLQELRDASNTGTMADIHLGRAIKQLKRAMHKTDFSAPDPPDPPAPPDDPPIPDAPPLQGRAPIDRIDPVTPERIDIELTREGARRMSDGQKYTNLRDVMSSIGPTAETVIVGVRGDGGYVQFGDKYGINPGWPLSIAFVGLTDDATIGPMLHKSDEHPVEVLELHRIGLVAKSDSFAFRQGGFIRRMILNDWWIIPLAEGQISQASGWYCAKGWDLFVCKGYQSRGTMFREHVVYPKGGGMVQFLDNDMRGFGRTFANHRPHQAGTQPYAFGGTLPTLGPILWDGNFSDMAGWDRDVMEGGAVMTCWLGLEHPVVFRNNKVTNARMGGIMCARGAPNTNPFETFDGYSFRQIWLEGNDIHVNGKDGSDPRHAVNISDVDQLIFSGPNEFKSVHRMGLQLNSAGFGGRPVGDIRVLGKEAVPVLSASAIWIKSLGKSIPLTSEHFNSEIE